VGLEGDSVDNAEGEDCGREDIVAAVRREVGVFSKVPVLPLKVEFELEWAGDIDVNAAAVGVGETAIFVIAWSGVGGVDDAAKASEEVYVGIEGTEVRLGTKTCKHGALGDCRTGTVDAAKLEGRRHREVPEVASDVGLGGEAVIAGWARIGGKIDVASGDGDVHSFGIGGMLLCEGKLGCQGVESGQEKGQGEK